MQTTDKMVGHVHTLRSMSAAWSSLLIGSMTAPAAGCSVVCLGAAGNDIVRGMCRVVEKDGWNGGKRAGPPPNLLSCGTL